MSDIAPLSKDEGLPELNDSKRILFLTAGAAGMFCGSCMHDNAVAKALIAQGHDCILQPIYTPIRTDEDSVARESVFFGGIQLYAIERFPWLQKIPARFRRWLDSPALIRMVTRQDRATDAKVLGELAVSMLKGDQGHHAEEVRRLTRWIVEEIKPDAIVLSNLLIGGSLPHLRSELNRAGRNDIPIAVMLQGDDIFLDHLPEPFHSGAMDLCRGLIQHVDHCITNSDFYSAKMGERLEIPVSKRGHLPLSIDTTPYVSVSEPSPAMEDGFRIGYLARIAPEKGLHHLVEAFLSVAQDPQHDNATLHVAGYLGEQNQSYFDSLSEQIKSAGLGERFTHHGELSLEEKVTYLQSLDVLCVPTDYHDPKGLFVLEALAAGVPVVQPNHGAFEQLVRETGGGLVYESGNGSELVSKLIELKNDRALRASFAQQGRARVLENHSVEQIAGQLMELIFRA